MTSPGTWHGLPRPVHATMNIKMYKRGSDSLDEKIIAEVFK